MDIHTNTRTISKKRSSNAKRPYRLLVFLAEPNVL